MAQLQANLLRAEARASGAANSPDLSSEWWKLSHLEDRLMRLNIKVHETLWQVETLVDVFDDKRSNMAWFTNKLGHELQDFVEAERLRLGLRHVADAQANAMIKLKLRLLLASVLSSEEMPRKNLEYLKVVEANFFKLLEKGDTVESLSKQLNDLEANPFPFYNSFTRPETLEKQWFWSFEQGMYLLLQRQEAEELKGKVEEAKKLLGLEGTFGAKTEEDLEEPEGEASKVEAEAKVEAKVEPKIEGPERLLEKPSASGSAPCAEA